MAKKTQKNTQPTVDDLKAPLLAAVGAADLALERVNDIVATLRERAGEARTDAETRVEESRARLTRLQEDLPSQFGDLRDRLSSEELRKFAETYAETAQSTYNKLVERGEVAIEKLRSQPALEEAAGRVQTRTDQAVELTQE
ncbi:MAG TPA: heparin-binding hemagglutinin, partial [Ilumatobacteraceae bacterium]|nr:heparin-binding hemagglutinin [Ilumatobacteraceae bacterium]